MNHDQELLRIARSAAQDRMEGIETALQLHLQDHPAYQKASERLDAVMKHVTPESDQLVQEVGDAWMHYSAVLAMEMYLHGVQDGGKLEQCFRESPMSIPKEAPVPAEKTKPCAYSVVVCRYGCVNVDACSADEAMMIVDKTAKTDDVYWDDDWTSVDAQPQDEL